MGALSDAILPYPAQVVSPVDDPRNIDTAIFTAMRPYRDEAMFAAAFGALRGDVLVYEVANNRAQRQDDIAKGLSLFELYRILYPVYIVQSQAPDIASAHPGVKNQRNNGPVTLAQRTRLRQDERLESFAVLVGEGFVYLADFHLLGKVMKDRQHRLVLVVICISSEEQRYAIQSQWFAPAGTGKVPDKLFGKTRHIIDSIPIQVFEERSCH